MIIRRGPRVFFLVGNMYFRKGDRESSSTSREKSTSEVEILRKFMGSRNRSNSVETSMIFDNHTQGAKEEKLSR